MPGFLSYSRLGDENATDSLRDDHTASNVVAMFDPYHKWLGIAKDQRPTTHYQLLGIPAGETDPEVIEDAAVRQSAHVRTYQIGEHAQLCTRLLNEIAQAKLVLLNPAKRRAYDEQLAKVGADKPSDAIRAGAAATPAPASGFRLEDDVAVPETPRPLDAPSIVKPAASGSAMRWAAICAGGGTVVLGIVVAVVVALGPDTAPHPIDDQKDDGKKRKRIVVIPKADKDQPVIDVVGPGPDELVGLVPDAPPQPPPPPGVAGKTTIDLIPLIDPAQDTVHGKWKVANNVLHCNDRGLVPRIQMPYQPPEEYDFTVTFSQPSLRNGISLVMPRPGGGSFFWFVGNRQGAGFGFSLKISEGRDLPKRLEVKRCYTTTAQIRKDRIRGLVDGEVLLDHPTDFRDLTSDSWRRLRDASVLAVACDDPTVFHYVRVTEITGAGKRLR